MGPIYYVYRFGGRDPQNRYLVTSSSVIPKNWSADPTTAELDQTQGGQVLHVSGPGSIAPRSGASEQQMWESEFQRDYPGLRDVGGGGDPWGATDVGEMTETAERRAEAGPDKDEVRRQHRRHWWRRVEIPLCEIGLHRGG